MIIIKVKDYQAVSETAAQIMIDDIKANDDIVLGLATGGSPVKMYSLLVEDHQENKTSYQNVKAFNLDEYIGLPEGHPQSYQYFMADNLFNHIDIDKNNIHIPKGYTADHQAEADAYEAQLRENVIDLQLLGIGTNGHIGFNEPGTAFDSLTSVVALTEETIASNARYFEGNLDLVPTQAISMGIGSIMRSKKILLIASGANKAEAVRNTVEGVVDVNVPASILQQHDNVILVVDEAAASLLTK